MPSNKVIEPKYKNTKNYKFCVIAGNYPAALRKVMIERGNWAEIESEDAID